MFINCDCAEYIQFYMYVSYARLWHGYGEDTFHIYRVSQEECAGLREGVPYVKVY